MMDASVGYRVPDLEYVVPLSGVYFINTIISVSVASEDGGQISNTTQLQSRQMYSTTRTFRIIPFTGDFF